MRWWMHILFWIGIWLWMTSVYIYNLMDLRVFLLYNAIRLPVIILATYAVAKWVVEDRLLAPKPNYWKALGVFVLIFLGASVIDRLIAGNTWVQPTVNGEPLHFEFFLPIPIAKNTFLLFSIISFGAAIQFYRINSRNQKKIYELQQEKLKTELAFLRSQINPHFLFNTFNNLYAMSQAGGNEELSRGLQGMSKLMRYLTYESNVPQVALVKEIELLESFIALHRLRLGEGDDMSIVFRVNGDPTGKVIAPVLLLPLVENAFKHGYKYGQPSWININLTIKMNQIIFEVKNKKYRNVNMLDGVGLQNLRKRLDLIYPDSHSLEITDDRDIFRVLLKFTSRS